jgi:hypothetical protein
VWPDPADLDRMTFFFSQENLLPTRNSSACTQQYFQFATSNSVVVPLCRWALCTTTVPPLLVYGVHPAHSCSRAVVHGHNAGLCTVLTCFWSVANFGFCVNSWR